MKRFIPFIKQDPLVAVIRLQGVIASGSVGGQTLSDVTLGPLIEKAFRRGKPAAVALAINSPGGSAVQSSLIAARIRRLADEKEVPVYAFVEDVAASGGYWLAVAADEIWTDPTSIVGSIGVITATFGFHDFISRYGVERRLYTSGEHKSLLDPFQPEKPTDVERLKDIQRQIHENFIAHVKARRGAKLAETDLYNGQVWVGDKAQDVGLIDGIGHLVPKMKEVFGDKVRFAAYQTRRSWLSRFGARIVGDAMAEVESRAMLARYGL